MEQTSPSPEQLHPLQHNWRPDLSPLTSSSTMASHKLLFYWVPLPVRPWQNQHKLQMIRRIVFPVWFLEVFPDTSNTAIDSHADTWIQYLLFPHRYFIYIFWLFCLFYLYFWLSLLLWSCALQCTFNQPLSIKSLFFGLLGSNRSRSHVAIQFFDSFSRSTYKNVAIERVGSKTRSNFNQSGTWIW